MDQTAHEKDSVFQLAGVRLFALSFTALFLELLVIRWVPSEVRLVAYYANLMLISSFLGLGVGAMLAERPWPLVRWFLPVMGAMVICILLFSGHAMPGSSGEARFWAESHTYGYVVLVLIFLLNTLMFVPIGQEVGRLFTKLPPLIAYSWDLGGSLAGTLIFGLFSIQFFSPLVGFLVVIGIFFLVYPQRLRMLDPAIAVLVVVIIAASSNRGAIWSAYHYLTVEDGYGKPVIDPEPNHQARIDPMPYRVRVNQDIYQLHSTIDPRRYTEGQQPGFGFANRYNMVQYALPYTVRPGVADALVLGAGGGLDVEAARLAGAKSVDAVEIDRAIVGIGRRFSAADNYGDPTVRVHIDDARAFLQRADKQYDAVIFGFLDSQNLFSYGTNLRLDGYIYTVECFRRAFELVREGGLMSVSFSVPKPWVAEKLVRMLQNATGTLPAVYRNKEMPGQYVMLVPKLDSASFPSAIQMFERQDASAMLLAELPLASDDWPYLYLSKPGIPFDYVVVIGTLAIISIAGVLALRASTRVGLLDAHFFFLGWGFLLLQTKSIGDCSLYFGTTWVVSMIVICGTLLMVLLANVVAMRMRQGVTWAYVPLLGSLLLLILMPRHVVLGWDLTARLTWAVLIVPLPIFFAGLVFSATFRLAEHPAACFGANLIGATIGGFCEYLGMWIGTGALSYIIIAVYLASLMCLLFRSPTKRLNPVGASV